MTARLARFGEIWGKERQRAAHPAVEGAEEEGGLEVRIQPRDRPGRLGVLWNRREVDAARSTDSDLVGFASLLAAGTAPPFAPVGSRSRRSSVSPISAAYSSAIFPAHVTHRDT